MGFFLGTFLFSDSFIEAQNKGRGSQQFNNTFFSVVFDCLSKVNERFATE